MSVTKFTLTVPSVGYEKTISLNVEKQSQYLIHFRRPDNYEGEFGFDWMRDNYKEICNDYEALKKEYYDAENKKVELEGQEYFVPWLSMFPNQKGVKLKLEIEKIDDFKPKAEDFIEIFPKDGIQFNPNKLKISEITENTMIEVFCKPPLQNDITIDVKNNKGNTVGKLNVFTNNEILSLDVKFVKVYNNETHLEPLKELNSTRIENGYIEVLKKSLGQSLINVNIVENDFDKWEFIKIDNSSKEIILFDDSNRITKEGRSEIKKMYPTKNFKGIVVFYTSFNKVERERFAAGDAQSYPLDDKFIFIYQNSARNIDLAHEVGHTLGLEHSFDEHKDKEKKILTQKQRIEILELEIKKEEKEQQLNVKKDKLFIMKKNIHKYKMGKTTNMMDYTEYGVFDIKDFFHWQWKVMRDEVKEYYT